MEMTFFNETRMLLLDALENLISNKSYLAHHGQKY